MANRYLRSTDGSNSDNGTTWALAKATLAGAATILSAGDVLYVSQSHAEASAGGTIAPDFNSTGGNPIKIICGNDGAAPPTALATTATFSISAGGQISLLTVANRSNYYYGCSFITTGTINTTVGGSGHTVFQNCNFRESSTTAARGLSMYNAVGGFTEFLNCGFKFSAATQGFFPVGTVLVRGGSIEAGGTAINAFITLVDVGTNLLVEGMDLSQGATAMRLINDGGFSGSKAVFRNCKLPASWSGTLHSTSCSSGNVFEMHNCAAGDTHYAYQRVTMGGLVEHETTIVRTGGSSNYDGTALSWKMSAASGSLYNPVYPVNALESAEIVKKITTVGSPITATVEIVHDSVTALTDAQVYGRVQYLGTSGVPIAAFADDAKATILATAANQASSSVTWTTTGLTNPNKQKLGVTFTPQEAGFIHFTVVLTQLAKVIYVDPLITIT